MGCLHSNENKKKYLDEDPFQQSENRPPTDCQLTRRKGDQKIIMKKSYQKKLVKIQDNKSNKGKDSDKLQISRRQNSVKSNKKLQSRTNSNSKNSTQKQKAIPNRPVKIIRTTKQNPQVNLDNKNDIQKKQQLSNLSKSNLEENKNAQQQERILSILKRSANIGRVYRKVCAEMIKYNLEEFEQKSQVGN